MTNVQYEQNVSNYSVDAYFHIYHMQEIKGVNSYVQH
jgi:hypothetical protein